MIDPIIFEISESDIQRITKKEFCKPMTQDQLKQLQSLLYANKSIKRILLNSITKVMEKR
jgi:hypothetical protein